MQVSASPRQKSHEGAQALKIQSIHVINVLAISQHARFSCFSKELESIYLVLIEHFEIARYELLKDLQILCYFICCTFYIPAIFTEDILHKNLHEFLLVHSVVPRIVNDIYLTL